LLPGRTSPTDKRKAEEPPIIVLDGPNIAMQHGSNAKFSTAGIQIAIEYWRARGYQVLAFLPKRNLEYKYVAERISLVRIGVAVKASQMPDNIALLNSLLDQGLVLTTPSFDYDDSYCIEFAKKHDACIVSNDRYRDHVDKQHESHKTATRRWLRKHCITYIFAGDEFMPNPDFVMEHI
jgi:hypothetical protein